jgi:alkylation response protein AidB-like acyl-CoA dehydrogenase
MDYVLKPGFEQIRHEARRRAESFSGYCWREHTEKHAFPFGFRNAFAEMGWIGIVVPEKCRADGMEIMETSVLGIGHSSWLLAQPPSMGITLNPYVKSVAGRF